MRNELNRNSSGLQRESKHLPLAEGCHVTLLLTPQSHLTPVRHCTSSTSTQSLEAPSPFLPVVSVSNILPPVLSGCRKRAPFLACPDHHISAASVLLCPIPVYPSALFISFLLGYHLSSPIGMEGPSGQELAILLPTVTHQCLDSAKRRAGIQ